MITPNQINYSRVILTFFKVYLVRKEKKNKKNKRALWKNAFFNEGTMPTKNVLRVELRLVRHFRECTLI